jgi:hypothetical protein
MPVEGTAPTSVWSGLSAAHRTPHSTHHIMEMNSSAGKKRVHGSLIYKKAPFQVYNDDHPSILNIYYCVFMQFLLSMSWMFCRQTNRYRVGKSYHKIPSIIIQS